MKSKKTTPTTNRYSESFKIKVVREYERGNHTKDGLMLKYRIGGHSVVLDWLRKYGKLHYPKTTAPGCPMKDPQKQKIKELEYQLKEAQNKLLVYEKLLEVVKRDEGIDLLKNTDTKLSGKWQPMDKL